MKIQWKKLLICLAIPLAVGGLAALLSGGMGDYKALRQPPFAPPGWVFPIVWSILYLLMGYSSYRVLISDKDPVEIRNALKLYGAQLILNFVWPIVFFGLEWRLVAFFILVALWVFIYLTIRAFSKIDEQAGDLLLPYILWVTFAGYLNLGVYFLNRN
ncbi:MAG: tryptophan-rich sensory protein [Oscillospiraceae bacterium]|nr:tryptophan-rich sensory protein [Oscillospiraceae bacterium]